MADATSRRGFLRGCAAAAIVAPSLPAIVGAAIETGPARMSPPTIEFGNEPWNRGYKPHYGFSTRYIEAFFGTATHDHHFSGWVDSDIRPTPRPEAPGLEWPVTEDRGPDVMPFPVGG